MSFTPAQATDIRRHCGYPAIGNANTAFDNWRFYQAYGLLEYRIVNLSDSEQAVVLNYLGTLALLEAAIPNASATLDTEQASIWTRNSAELTERIRLFDDWRRRLCAFFGVPPGPALASSSQTMTLMV